MRGYQKACRGNYEAEEGESKMKAMARSVAAKARATLEAALQDAGVELDSGKNTRSPTPSCSAADIDEGSTEQSGGSSDNRSPPESEEEGTEYTDSDEEEEGDDGEGEGDTGNSDSEDDEEEEEGGDEEGEGDSSDKEGESAEELFTSLGKRNGRPSPPSPRHSTKKSKGPEHPSDDHARLPRHVEALENQSNDMETRSREEFRARVEATRARLLYESGGDAVSDSRVKASFIAEEVCAKLRASLQSLGLLLPETNAEVDSGKKPKATEKFLLPVRSDLDSTPDESSDERSSLDGGAEYTDSDNIKEEKDIAYEDEHAQPRRQASRGKRTARSPSPSPRPRKKKIKGFQHLPDDPECLECHVDALERESKAVKKDLAAIKIELAATKKKLTTVEKRLEKQINVRSKVVLDRMMGLVADAMMECSDESDDEPNCSESGEY